MSEDYMRGLPSTRFARAVAGGFMQRGMVDLRERIAALESEIAAARKEIEALRIKPWQDQIEAQSAEISRLRYERDEARKDAARLAFYRTNATTHEQKKQEILDVCNNLISTGIAFAHQMQLTEPEYPAVRGLAEIMRILEGSDANPNTNG